MSRHKNTDFRLSTRLLLSTVNWPATLLCFWAIPEFVQRFSSFSVPALIPGDSLSGRPSRDPSPFLPHSSPPPINSGPFPPLCLSFPACWTLAKPTDSVHCLNLIQFCRGRGLDSEPRTREANSFYFIFSPVHAILKVTPKLRIERRRIHGLKQQACSGD